MAAIARYRAINYLKKYARDLEHIHFDEISPYVKGPNDAPFQKEFWQIELDELLEPLNEQDKQLFIELFSQEQSIDEVAEKYNLSKDNLYQRVSRGRKKLNKRRRENGSIE